MSLITPKVVLIYLIFIADKKNYIKKLNVILKDNKIRHSYILCVNAFVLGI